MTNKVYLLTGEWLDDERHVFAVFSTRQAAEAALRFGDETSLVEDLVIDPPLPSAPEGHSLWVVQEFKGYTTFRVSAFYRDQVDQVIDEGDSCCVYVWALDEDHALWAGAERIRRFKAGHALPASV